MSAGTITVCAALRLPRASPGCPRRRPGGLQPGPAAVPRRRGAVGRVLLAVSEFGQLGAGRHDPHTARTEIYDQGAVNLDADDPAEAVRIVGNLIPHGELLSRRSGGREAEGTRRQEAPGRGAGGRWVLTGGGGYALVQVVPRAWTHLLAEAAGQPVDRRAQTPMAWREYAEARTGEPAPEWMTDWEPAAYRPLQDLRMPVFEVAGQAAMSVSASACDETSAPPRPCLR